MTMKATLTDFYKVQHKNELPIFNWSGANEVSLVPLQQIFVRASDSIRCVGSKIEIRMFTADTPEPPLIWDFTVFRLELENYKW